MSTVPFESSNIDSKLTDLLVLSSSFLIFSSFSNSMSHIDLTAGLVIYSVVLFVCMRIGKYFINPHTFSSIRAANVLLGNFAGLTVGSIISAFLIPLFTATHSVMSIIIFASFMAFFVLGTLSPLVKEAHMDVMHR